MSNQTMDKNEIHRLADDIRVIKNFTKNHGFDSSLLSVDISPAINNNKIQRDYSLICFLISSSVFVVCICLNIFIDSTEKTTMLLMVASLLFIGFSTMSAHIKFNNNGATLILAVSMVVVFLIGFGILTPKEVIDKAEQYIPKT